MELSLLVVIDYQDLLGGMAGRYCQSTDRLRTKGSAMESASSSVGRPRTFDNRRVVEVAVESYWTDGVEAVSLNEICRRAGVSKPGLYREFGGEDGLMNAALGLYAETVLAPNLQKADGDRPLGDVLAAMIEFMVDVDRSGPAGCLLANMRQVPDRLGPATRKRVADLREEARSMYYSWVERAKEAGEVDANISTEVAVALIDLQLTNLLVQVALGEDPGLLSAQAKLSFAALTKVGSNA